MSEEITLEEAFKRTNYTSKKDIIELLSTYLAESKIYLKKDEKVLMINKYVPLLYKAKKLNLSILIYLPDDYPKVEPLLFLEAKNRYLIVNPAFKNKEVNEHDLKINYKRDIPWKKKNNTFKDIFMWIHRKFNNNFPLYSSKNLVNYDPKCIIIQSDLISVKPPSGINLSEGAANIFGLSENESYNLQKEIKQPVEPPIDKNKKLNDEEAKELMRKEVSGALKKELLKKENISVVTERRQLEAEDKMLTTKINNQNTLHREVLASKVECDTLVKDFQKETERVSKEIKKAPKELTLTQIGKMIPNSEKEKLKYWLMEETLNNYIMSLRKVFEKNCLNFSKTSEEIRKLSREMFYIKYLKSKSLK